MTAQTARTEDETLRFCDHRGCPEAGTRQFDGSPVCPTHAAELLDAEHAAEVWAEGAYDRWAENGYSWS